MTSQRKRPDEEFYMKLSVIPTTVRTTCPYCGVGCGVNAQVGQDGGIAIAVVA